MNRQKKTPDHVTFLNALRAVLGLEPLPFTETPGRYRTLAERTDSYVFVTRGARRGLRVEGQRY